MSYTITRTNGTTLGTIADGTYDNIHTSLTLVGRNFANYGQIMTNNLVKLLENSSYSISPSYPLSGQLWWDSGNNLLKVYTGSAWKNVGSVTSQATAPSTIIAGDLWFDSTNQQLYIYNGTSPYDSTGWVLVGPSFSAAHKTGAIVEIITDTLAVNHYVIGMYVDGSRTGIVSKDTAFTPNPSISGLSSIQPGYNMIGSYQLWGTANNASYLGTQPAANFWRNNQNNTGTGTLSIVNDGGVTIGASGDLSLSVNDINAQLINNTLNGDFSLYLNSGSVQTRYLFVDGATGIVEVAADPSTTLGVATKHYVDYSFSNSPVLGGLPTAATQAAGTNNTTLATTAFVHEANVGLKAYVDSVKASSDNDISYLAPKANPTLTGDPKAPTPPIGDNDTSIATTAFVYSANLAIKGYVDTEFTSINAALTLKSPIDSPTFTGNPKAPTPDSGDNDTSIATTAFVQAAVGGAKDYGDTNVSYKANIAGPTFTGVPKADTAPPGTNTTQIATTAFVYQANLSLKGYTDAAITTINGTLVTKSPIADPTFTGNPKAPTPLDGDNDTSIATTAFVQSANLAIKGYVDAADALKATIASPTFTGNPQAPTPAFGDNSTSIATTAFVQNNTSINKVYQNNSWLWIADTGTGGANLVIDSTTVMVATSSGMDIKNGAVAVTQPDTYNGAGNARIATTQFVKNANQWWGGSAKFVSTSAPNPGVNDTGSNNGDFWFQISS